LAPVATALGIELRGGAVAAEGDLDFRGTLAVAKDVPVGFKQIRIHISLPVGKLSIGLIAQERKPRLAN
jgi:hypothetical protein